VAAQAVGSPGWLTGNRSDAWLQACSSEVEAHSQPLRAKTREKLKSGVAAWEWVAFLAGLMRSCSEYGIYG